MKEYLLIRKLHLVEKAFLITLKEQSKMDI